MFTPADRATLRARLLEQAKSDPRITAAAITGSAAVNAEDQWSDIDLAFAHTTPLEPVLADWTETMYTHHNALRHTDLQFGPWLYRVFLLKNTLQVDLAFVPANEFRPLSPTFQLQFGQAHEPAAQPEPQPEPIIGMAWLYALHVRSAIARNKPWQAEHMLTGMRNQLLALLCLRHALPTAHGKGIDQLPNAIKETLEPTLPANLTTPELTRAFRATTEALTHEVDQPLALTLHHLANPPVSFQATPVPVQAEPPTPLKNPTR